MNSVPIIIPAVIINPMLKRLLAPAPDAITRGQTPSTVAKVVIRIGRRRNDAASTTASLRSMPCSASLLANSTISIPCLLIRPISVSSPTWV